MIVACDPGIHGAFALNDWATGRLEIVPMPTQQRFIAGRKLRTVIDEAEVVSTLACYAAMGATTFFIEQVSGLPGQSAPAAFTFGQGYGTVRAAAIAAGMALESVPAAVWKVALKVPKDKSAARMRASEMIPTHRHLWAMAKDDGLAEAALLSLYGQRWITGGVKRSKKDIEAIAAAAEQRDRNAARARDKAEATKARTAAERAREPSA
jgi:crossover junction endodeoxyribonuclease RuvC